MISRFLISVVTGALGFGAGYAVRDLWNHPPCEIVVADASLSPSPHHYECMVKALTTDVAYQCAYLRCGNPPGWEPVGSRFATCADKGPLDDGVDVFADDESLRDEAMSCRGDLALCSALLDGAQRDADRAFGIKRDVVRHWKSLDPTKVAP